MAKKKAESKPLKSVDLAKLFPGKAEDPATVPDWYDYDKKLPAGDLFEVTFSPVERWKLGLQGFEIHGLPRSLRVGSRGSVEIDRDTCIKMICTLLKPGDVNLEDVDCYVSERKAEKKEKAEKEPAAEES